GEYLCDILDEVCDELPVVIFEEDFSLQYAPDADFKLVNVYNEAFKKIMDSDNVDILRDLPTGEYYADLVVFKNGTEIHDGETGYDGYACGFKFVVPDVYEPIIEVYANGESVAAAEYWFCSRKWAENNWMYSDGMRLANRMKEVYKEFPEVQMEEDLFLQPGENTGQLKIRVYDDNLKFIGETTHPEVLKALSHGTYYLTIEVFRFGTDLHSDEVDYEGYECGLKLVVPKGSDSSATKRGVPLVSAVTKQGEIPLFKHNGTGIVWIGETPHEVYEDPIIGSPRTLERVWLLENMITSGNKAKLPTISETELIELKLADGIVFSHAAFFDEFGIKYAEYEESEHVLQNIRLSSELPKGRNYLMNVVVMEYGFELAEDERDCNIYEYACTLSIPE
ncbi:MAG: hypothetical protein IKK29_00705, partial [Christensenellaceae bacterium]|nr:hypothetical protein [Christensenellaceae bacterium]